MLIRASPVCTHLTRSLFSALRSVSSLSLSLSLLFNFPFDQTDRKKHDGMALEYTRKYAH